jgi:hypothetical protein
MCVIIDTYQPKVENIIEQKSNKTILVGKGTIASKILENNSDINNDSSDSDDDIMQK